MKRLLCLFLAFVLCITACPIASATSTSIDPQIYELAYDLVYDALTKNSYFDIAYDSETTFSLCEPINAHRFVNGELSANLDIEYYLVMTDSEYAGCITVCYDNGNFRSASFDTNIALALNYYGIGNEPIALVGYNGTLYIKTSENTFEWTSATVNSEAAQFTLNTTSECTTVSMIDTCECVLVDIEPICEFPPSITQVIAPRISSILDVPYIPQYSYPICWACAAAAFGRYYTGTQYENITGTTVAYRTKGALIGGTISDTQNALSSIFGITTALYIGQMPYNTIINHLMGSNPLLTFFHTGDLVDEPTGHAVVLCGFVYNSGSTIKYYFRDSNFESLKIVTTSTSSTLALDYLRGDLMYWDAALYKAS